VRHLYWRCALLIVLALLGHDLLMAGAALSAPVPLSQTTTHSHDAAQLSIGGDMADPDKGDQPDHPATCGVASVAAPTLTYQFACQTLGSPGRAFADLLAASCAAWVDSTLRPSWAPGMQRALLQVFRI
jgi:hypothetical protein